MIDWLYFYIFLFQNLLGCLHYVKWSTHLSSGSRCTILTRLLHIYNMYNVQHRLKATSKKWSFMIQYDGTRSCHNKFAYVFQVPATSVPAPEHAGQKSQSPTRSPEESHKVSLHSLETEFEPWPDLDLECLTLVFGGLTSTFDGT